MILHFSQIFFTDERTFISFSSKYHKRSAADICRRLVFFMKPS